MEKESSENNISANGEVAESSSKEKEDKQEGQGLDLVENIKQEPSDEKSDEQRSDSEINSKTENAEEKGEDNDTRDEEMDTTSGNSQEQKSSKQPSAKKQSPTKPPSSVVKNGDCTPTATKEKESVNEKVATPTSASQPSPATQTSASRNNVNTANTRSTRSQNPEFLARQRNFLQKVHLASYTKGDDMLMDEDENSAGPESLSRTSACSEDSDAAIKRKRERSASSGAMSPANVPGTASSTGNNSGSSSPALTQQQIKKRRTTRLDSSGAQMSPVNNSPIPVGDISVDRFCWVCHKDGVAINCVTCPRVYHLRCVQLDTAPTVDWVCPECSTILQAENFDTRSRAMRLLSLEQLCTLLKFAVSRMKATTGAEPFCKAVDVTEFQLYRNYVAHPMDLSLLERNIKKRMYGSTEAFIADTKWILHNCIIFNTYQSRLTGVAKQLVKICKQEMSEIENCPDCYLYAHTRKDSWFIEVCRKPHVLVWAKLKGFPFWPAKVMRTNKDGMVDVRFFGAHDRAWVPMRECFLYSKTMPASARNKKRNNLEACIEEVEAHTKKLRDRFGAFEHAPFRVNFDPSKATEQLRLLLPKYNPNDEGGPTSAKRARLSGGYASRRSLAIAQDSVKVEEQIAAAAAAAAAAAEKAGNNTKEESKPVEQAAPRDIESSEEDSRQDLAQKRASRESSITSEESQGSDEAVLKDRKSASLIEWSRFEESAAKLTTGEDGDDEPEDDKQSGSFDDPKKDECSNSSMDLPEMRATETSAAEKSEVERSAFELETSEVVKKVAEGLTKVAIADKLQEKLLQMEKNLQQEENENEDCETSAQNKKQEMNKHKTDSSAANDSTEISAADSGNNKQTEGDTDAPESTEAEKVTDSAMTVSPVSADTATTKPAESGKQVSPKVIVFNADRDEVPEDTNNMSSKTADESPSLASECVAGSKEGIENEECSKSTDSSSRVDNKNRTVEPTVNSMHSTSGTVETENHLTSKETKMHVDSSETEMPNCTENEQQAANIENELESSNQPSAANAEMEESSLQDSNKEKEKESDTAAGDTVVRPAEDATEESIGIKKEVEDEDNAADSEMDKAAADVDSASSEKTANSELQNNAGIRDENCSKTNESVPAAAAAVSARNENEEAEPGENTAVRQPTVLPFASEERLQKTNEPVDSLSERPSSEKEGNSSSSTLTASTDVPRDASRATETTEVCGTDNTSATQKEICGELERPIKEEPVDPDDVPAEAPTAKTTDQSDDRPSTEDRQSPSAAEKENVADKNLSSGVEDKDRQASNASPALSDQDGIFPSLFLDPSITITVVNDKQSEPSEVPTVNKTSNNSSANDINVSNLRASVNLSKDISLTVVGADYGGHVSSGKEIMGLDMECDHASDHESCDSPPNSTSAAATSPMSLTVQNSPSSILGQSAAKKTRRKPSGPSDLLQARSRARKSFPNKALPNVTLSPQPELMNGTTGFGNKPNSLLRRNSATGADSRLSSCGPLPHHDIIPQQHGNQMHGENSTATTTTTDSNSVIIAPPMLGNNMPQNSTNPLQALRAVNGNIGAPSTHLVNGNSEANISARMLGPQATSGPRISPASASNSRMPPQLQPRPSGPLLSQHPPPVPSEAGQITAELNRHSQKISDCVRAALHDMLRDLSTLGNPQATIKSLQLELERQQWLHKQELAEMKHNADLLVMEMRASMEGESQRILNETLQRCELEKQRAVEETKKKQWCTNCGKEALFYCCWNTSYCDYPCQQHHWPQHMSSCAQNQPVENREGGEMNQQNSPKQSGRGMNQNKAAAQQQQKQSGKFIGGPPLSYSGPTQISPQRGRMPNPNQYLGPRGNNMQVSGYSKSATQITSTASALLTTSTTESAFPAYICNVPRRPPWWRPGPNAAAPETNGISVSASSSSTATSSYGIQYSSASLLPMSK